MSLVHDRVISAERRGVLAELEKRRFAPIHEELEMREGDAAAGQRWRRSYAAFFGCNA